MTFFLQIRTGDTGRFGLGIAWGAFFSVSGMETRGFCSVYLEILVFPEFAKRRIMRFFAENPGGKLKLTIGGWKSWPHHRASIPLIGLWSCYSIGNGHRTLSNSNKTVDPELDELLRP